MPEYRIPGVYVQEIPGGPRRIQGTEPSTAAFVGAFQRGPLHHPVLVTGVLAFERVFGARDPGLPAAEEVRQFFHNGGRRAWILRTAAGAPMASGAVLESEGVPVLRITAAGRVGGRAVEDPGGWGDRLRVEIDHGPGPSFDLTVRQVAPDDRAVRSETFQGLILEPGATNEASAVVNAVSGLIRLDRDGLPPLAAPWPRPDATSPGGGVALTGGDDGGPLDSAALLGEAGSTTGLGAVPEGVGLVALPDAAHLGPGEARRTFREAAGICEDRNAFLLVDPPVGIDDVAALLAWVEDEPPLRHRNAALHVPRLVVPDASAPSGEREIGTSGSMAGLYARTDTERGVWKAPAGAQAILRHVMGTSRDLVRSDLEVLNPRAVNAIRAMAGGGLVNWGARTLVGQDGGSSEWRYVPVRRLALFLETSLQEGLRWTVFEPNEPTLWTAVRSAVDAFLMELFRAGALQGSKPEHAWYARCGRDTTPQAELQAGVLHLEVGFAPVRPAEFTVLRVRLTTSDRSP